LAPIFCVIQREYNPTNANAAVVSEPLDRRRQWRNQLWRAAGPYGDVSDLVSREIQGGEGAHLVFQHRAGRFVVVVLGIEGGE
jgi:hypothetical protein